MKEQEFNFKKKYQVMYPRNEIGVIFLFGICYKDFYFESPIFNNSFPDASAFFRPLKKRIKIEFEFQSSNFISHKHDVNGADMIICWKHDAYYLPVLVFELISGLFYRKIGDETVKIFKKQEEDSKYLKKFWEEIN